MLVIDGEDRRAVAEVILALDLGGGGRLDQQAVAQHGLARSGTRGEVDEMLRLQHRLAVGVGRAVADVEDHDVPPEDVSLLQRSDAVPRRALTSSEGGEGGPLRLSSPTAASPHVRSVELGPMRVR